MVRPPPPDMTRPRSAATARHHMARPHSAATARHGSAATARHGEAAFGRHRPTWRGRVRPPPLDMARPRSAATARHDSTANTAATARQSEMNHYFLFAIIIIILLFKPWIIEHRGVDRKRARPTILLMYGVSASL